MSYKQSEQPKQVYESYQVCDGPNHEQVGNKINENLMREGFGGIEVTGGYASPIDMFKFHFCDLPCLIDWANTPEEKRIKWYENEYYFF